MSREETDELSLEKSFKETLTAIRPRILTLSSADDAKLCGVWLDKLSRLSTQRNLRNEYAVELRRQLDESGCAGGIFAKLPPDGPLLPLRKAHEAHRTRTSDASSGETSDTQSRPETDTKGIVNRLLVENQRLKKELLHGEESSHLRAAIQVLAAQVLGLKAELKELQERKDQSTDKEWGQSSEPPRHVLLKEIAMLKGTIDKLERSRDQLLRDYERKLSRIVQGKELEIKVLQLQLYGQKKDVSTSMSAEMRCELDGLLDNLEARYKALLAAANAEAENQRKSYIKRIAFLEEQVVRLQRETRR